MGVRFGVGMAMVLAVMSSPPQRPFLQALQPRQARKNWKGRLVLYERWAK